MNKQIKVDELPKDWLVLDHHVESGNAKIIKKGKYFCEKCKGFGRNQYDITKTGYCRYSLCLSNNFVFQEKSNSITKHIQLVYVNVNVSEDGTVWGGDGQTVYGYVSNKVYKDIEELSIDKDFFIYKVTEEK